MSIPDPCCGARCCPLQQLTKLFAIMNIILASIVIAINIVVVVLVLDINSTRQKMGFDIRILFILVIVFSVAYLVFSIILYLGANERSKTKCCIWLIGNGFYLLIELIALCFVIWMRAKSTQSIVIHVIGILVNLYAIWVVLAFMEEIKTGIQVPIYQNQGPYIQQYPPPTQYQQYPNSQQDLAANADSDPPNMIKV